MNFLRNLYICIVNNFYTFLYKDVCLCVNFFTKFTLTKYRITAVIHAVCTDTPSVSVHIFSIIVLGKIATIVLLFIIAFIHYYDV